MFPAANLRLVRKLEREHLAAVRREERADDLTTSWRLAAASDRAARKLAAARDGLVIEPPRTRRNLAIAAFNALGMIGKVIARALTRAASLRRATLAATVKRAARKVATLARLAMRRAVLAVTALVVASPAVAEAHPGHPGGDAAHMTGPESVILVGVTLGLAAHAWATWGPKRRPVEDPDDDATDDGDASDSPIVVEVRQ